MISICIPAYKNEQYLKRLLDSIAIQDYKDFEVIISDDSPDNNLVSLISNYSDKFNIRYIRNEVALGSPANWNNAIKYATGEWIKIMHDDDWFADKTSLGLFAEFANIDSCPFVFSGFSNIYSDGKAACYTVNKFQKWLLRRSPLNLLKQNFIGHPSTTLLRNDFAELYDERLKWLVDIEYYVRMLTKTKKEFILIKKSLINIGIGQEQITALAFRNPVIEIPENIYLLNKLGVFSLKNIIVYDYYWRFIRNLRIRNVHMLNKYCPDYDVPEIIVYMVNQQRRCPAWLLNVGFFSKLIMIMTYFLNKTKGMLK